MDIRAKTSFSHIYTATIANLYRKAALLVSASHNNRSSYRYCRGTAFDCNNPIVICEIIEMFVNTINTLKYNNSTKMQQFILVSWQLVQPNL